MLNISNHILNLNSLFIWQNFSYDDIIKAVEIGQTIDVNITKESIGAMHRMGKKGQRPRAVIMRTNRLIKKSIMLNKNKLKNAETPQKNINIYDDMTAPRRKLHTYCKNHDKVDFCFVRDGAIIVKLKSGDFHKVETADDLFHLGDDNVDYRDFYVFQDLS